MTEHRPAPLAHLRATWPEVLYEKLHEPLARALLEYATGRRWFRGKARGPRAARVLDVVLLGVSGEGVVAAAFVVLEVSYEVGEPEVYGMPVAQAIGISDDAHAIAWLEGPRDRGDPALVDGLTEGTAASALLALVADGGLRRGSTGALRGEASPERGPLDDARTLPTQVSAAEQSNSSVLFGKRALLKIYRQLVAGANPELEMGRFLSAHARRPPTPRVLGALTHLDAGGTARNVGVVHELVPNEGDAWALVQRELRAQLGTLEREPARTRPAPVERFPALAATLGRRVAELHLALADVPPDADRAFAVETFSADDRAEAAAGVERALGRTLDALGRQAGRLAPGLRPLIDRLLDPASRERTQVAGLLTGFRDTGIDVAKTRVHGDLHLGQVLVCGDDFIIIDFEGEPSRPLAERRAKSSPLRDLVGMTRSFDYAPAAALRAERAVVSPDASFPSSSPPSAAWAARWKREVTGSFERGYFEAANGAPFLPAESAHLRLMVDFYALERVIYEIGYETDNRPDWVEIPLRGLEALLAGDRVAP